MEEYSNYDLIVRLKILILKYGVKFIPTDLFNHFENIIQYKIRKELLNQQSLSIRFMINLQMKLLFLQK